MASPSLADGDCPFQPAFEARVDATNLGTVDRSGGRVSVEYKAMINAHADVNELPPLEYRWA